MNERTSRQSFLGPNSDHVIRSATAGLVGLGGGGSHIAQQLAHIGFQNFVIYDHDVIEDSNLNRLEGGTVADVEGERPKQTSPRGSSKVFSQKPSSRLSHPGGKTTLFPCVGATLCLVV